MLKKSRICILLLLVGLTSCNNNVPDVSVFTINDFNGAMTGTYDWLRLYTDSYYNLSEISSDEMIVPPGTSSDADFALIELHRHTWTPNNSVIAKFWIDAYTGVQTANLALFINDELENVTIPAEALAEARGLRAFYYFQLLDILGNVQLVTEKSEINVVPPQVTRKELFEFIESELIELTPDLEVAPTYGRFSQGTANMLLAKLYLNAEVFSGTPQWEKCRDACDAVINDGRYQLATNYDDNFKPANNESTELLLPAIFSLGNTGIVMDFARRSIHPGQYTPLSPTVSEFRNWATLPELYNQFDHNTDLRASAFLVGPQVSETGDPYVTSSGFPIDYSIDIDEAKPYLSGARVAKYLIDDNDIFGGANDFMIFRFADVLLTKAEALNELGQTAAAVDLINEVRARAFESPQPLDAGAFTQESLRDQILQERATELFWEGFRRQDLIRHGKFCDSWTLKNTVDDCEKRQLFPIPFNALRDNPGLVQNPGY